jgi:hypothetical protein
MIATPVSIQPIREPLRLVMALNQIIMASMGSADRITPPSEAIITALQHVNDDLLLPLQIEEEAKADEE